MTGAHRTLLCFTLFRRRNTTILQIHGPFEIVLASRPSAEDSIVLFSYHFPEPVDPGFNPSSKPILVTDRQRKFNKDETKKAVVSVEDLECKFLRKQSKSPSENNTNILSLENSLIPKNRNQDCCVDLFVRSVAEHLSAYISRMDQVQELLPQNGATQADCGEVFNVLFSRDVTLVKFVLKLVDSNSRDGKISNKIILIFSRTFYACTFCYSLKL